MKLQIKNLRYPTIALTGIHMPQIDTGHSGIYGPISGLVRHYPDIIPETF